MTRNPMLPMYCDWTLEDGYDCMMLAVAIMTTGQQNVHYACMPHAREFYRWLNEQFGDGPVLHRHAACTVTTATRALAMPRAPTVLCHARRRR